MLLAVEDRVLPFSNEGYHLNCFGEILRFDGSLAPVEMQDGVKWVYLKWIDGLRWYKLSWVVAVTFYQPKMPFTLWDRIDPIHHDGDEMNTIPSNIGYRFKNGPIAVEAFPGFFYIPFYTGYCVNHQGDVINVDTGHQMTWSIWKPAKGKKSKGGYRNCGAKRDIGGMPGLSRHRAIALTFIPCESCCLKRVVNHKDGIPGNDWIDNLEWVTRKQNNTHAVQNGLVDSRLVKILVKDLRTNEVQSYPSIAECARALKRSEGFVFQRVYVNPHRRDTDGLVFKLDDGSEWPVLEDVFRSGSNKSIAARNVFTGEIIILDSAAQASQELNVPHVGGILSALKALPGSRPPMNGFDFQYCAPEMSWPDYTARDMQMFQTGTKGKAVIVQDEKGEELAFYPTVQEAAKQLQTSEPSIYRACSNKHIAKTLEGKTLSFYEFEPKPVLQVPSV